MTMPTDLTGFKPLAEIAEGADDFHVLTFESRKTLRQALAAMLSYSPGWMRFLYRVRKWFVLMLGVRQELDHDQPAMTPEEISFSPGDKAAFFTVTVAEEDRFWLAQAQDAMIVGYVGLAAEPLENGVTRFHLVSGAKYLRWTARIYYNVISPFHHLVIRCMAREAQK